MPTKTNKDLRLYQSYAVVFMVQRLVGRNILPVFKIQSIAIAQTGRAIAHQLYAFFVNILEI